MKEEGLAMMGESPKNKQGTSMEGTEGEQAAVLTD